MTSGSDEIILAARNGKAIRFNERKTRPMGRNAAGVRGIRLADDKDAVVGMITIPDSDNSNVLVVSENGYGKRSDIEDYRVTNRGGKGVKTLNVTDKTGQLIAIKNVTDNDDLMIDGKKIAFGVDSFEDYKMWFEEDFIKLADLLHEKGLFDYIYLVCGHVFLFDVVQGL